MSWSLLRTLALCAALGLPGPAAAELTFGVVRHAAMPGANESSLRQALEETDADRLAFVVVHGIKSRQEPCSDELYARRKALLEDAGNGVVLSLAGRDWATCPVASRRASAPGRLNRMRELFFFDEFSLGGSRIPLVRQSKIAKFREFAENARWQIGDVVFATIHLPANNNNYMSDAGRNSEFEDRLVANQNWIQRTFTVAQREGAAGIVFFSDADPMAARATSGSRRDGFIETRKQVLGLAADFPGRILFAHGQPAARGATTGIVWNGNVGRLQASTRWTRIEVDPALPALFRIDEALPASEVRK